MEIVRVPTVREVLDAYRAEKRRDVAAGINGPRRMERIDHYLGIFCREYGDVPVNVLSRKCLREWIRNHPEWKKGATQECAAATVISGFRWADEEDEYQHVRIPRLRMPTDAMKAKTIRRPILEGEYRAVMRESREHRRACRESQVRFRMAFAFLWRTGARVGEMRAAKWSDIDWTPGLECIRLADHKTARKTGMARIIALDWLLVRMLRRLQKWNNRETPWIFTNNRGRPWSQNAFSDRFRENANRAGLPLEVTAYACRHAWACRALSLGVSELAVSYNLGHGSTRTTATYNKWLKFQPEQLLRTAARVNRKG